MQYPVLRGAGLSRRRLLALAGLLFARAVPAAEAVFDEAAFDAALAARRPVAIAFEADWCSTCSVQKPVVVELASEPRFAALTLFLADFDADLAIRRRLRVLQQSTVVVFKDGHEVARATGLTKKAALAALLARAL
ncbi:MAG: thioredoxin family protein [Rubrivivax sp.]|nr:thioredoxin family protein [Rubrivivax sp.]